MSIESIRSKSGSILFTTLTTIVATAALGPVALAQQGGDTDEKAVLDEVTVTAQKREQRAFDVPMSITALSGEDMEVADIHNSYELAYSVPSLSVTGSSSAGPNMGQITMRGIGNIRGTWSLVGLYLDESALAGSIIAPIDLRVVDLERIEVLRGPQGTLYGEGSAGGTIRYITKDPVLDRAGGKVNATLRSTRDGDMSQEVTGVVNIPLVSDVLGLRLSGTYEDQGGWIDRPAVARKDINNNELVNVRAKALWQPTAALQIKGSVTVHRNQGDGLNIVNRPDNGFELAVYPTLDDTSWVDDYDIYNLTGTYDFGFATLLATSSYTDLQQSYIAGEFLNRPDMLQDIFPSSYDVESFSHEIRMSSNGGGRLNWTAGFFYKDYELRTVRDTDYLFPLTGEMFFDDLTDMINSSKSWAVFGDASYEVTDRLEIGAGVRYFEDDQSFTDLVADGFTQDRTFDAVTTRIQASYALSDEVKVYASYGEGFRSGGFNTAQVIGVGGPPAYEPEDIKSYELGTKLSMLGGRLYSEFAVFFTNYRNLQTVELDPVILNNVGSNAGRGEISGVEWDVNWRLLDNLRLGFNGNIVTAELVSLSGAIGTSHLPGDLLDFVPAHGYSVSATYDFKWAPTLPGYFRLDFNEQGVITRTTRTVGYFDITGESDVLTFLNMRLGVETDKWTASVFAQNMLNENGFSSAWTQSETATKPRPRTFGVQIAYNFN